MRRAVAIVSMLLALAALLSGCARLVPEDETISVYATFYPIYALTDAVMDGVPDAELHCLVQPQDGCLRDYALSDWDLALLASGADAVVAGGRGLESFEQTLFGWGESGPAVAAVLYNLELYNREEGGDPEAESHLVGANPHLYMSIEGARRIVESISAMMLSLDPQYSVIYAHNVEAAFSRLDGLLAENRALLSDCGGRGVVLMNESLVYVARDYDLTVSEWIDRESGTAMSDNEFAACLERLEKVDAKVVLIEKQAPQALVEALEAAGYCVAGIDVLSTHREGEGFDKYIEIQRGNAQTIRAAFDRADAGKDL